MKLNKLALAVISVVAPVVATAGVTVSPLLLGYHHNLDATAEQQRAALNLGTNAGAPVAIDGQLSTTNPNGIAMGDNLYKGAAIGVEITPATQIQVEYGVVNTHEKTQSGVNFANKMDSRYNIDQTTISANALIGTEEFTGYSDSDFKPYVLIGGGQTSIDVKTRNPINTAVAPNTANSGIAVAVNKQVGDIVNNLESKKSIIGNVGVGARYLVNDALALRGEARATYNFDNKWWEGLGLAGLEVTLGDRLTPSVPVPPPIEPVEPPPVVVVPPPPPVVVVPPPVQQVEVPVLDSDMDGVPDNMDACPGTPRNLVVDARGCPRQVELVDDLRLELRVFFDNDKSIIKPQYRNEIAKVAEKMREYPNATAKIEGHASKTGPSARYNQRLSEARANAVKSMLSNEFGIASNRLSTIGYGYDRPIAPNNTAEGRAQNRRVYAVIEGDKTTIVNQTTDMQVQ